MNEDEERVCWNCGCQASSERQSDGSYRLVFGCLCKQQDDDDEMERIRAEVRGEK